MNPVLNDGTHRSDASAGTHADDRRHTVRRETEETFLQPNSQLITLHAPMLSPSLMASSIKPTWLQARHVICAESPSEHPEHRLISDHRDAKVDLPWITLTPARQYDLQQHYFPLHTLHELAIEN